MIAAAWRAVGAVRWIVATRKSREIKRELASTTIEAEWAACADLARRSAWGEVPDPSRPSYEGYKSAFLPTVSKRKRKG